jgi:WD40 repeat protein
MFSPTITGQGVLSATYNLVVKWSVRDTESEIRVLHETADVFFVAVLPDQTTAVSVTTQGEVRVWSLVSGQTVGEFFLDRILTAAALSQDCTRLFVAIRSGGVHALRLPNLSQQSTKS